MSFLSARPRSATVIACSDVDLLELKRVLLERVIKVNPQLVKYLYNIYTSQMDMTLDKLRKSEEAFSGSLREFQISDLLQILEQSRKKGRLNIISRDKTGMVSMDGRMILNASYGSDRGEDALIGLLSLTEGKFNYVPQDVRPGNIVKPIRFVLMECLRVLDEKDYFHDYIPNDRDGLILKRIPPTDDPEIKAVISILRRGSSRLEEIQKISGLSRIRVLVALAKLVKSGSVKAEVQV
jgi:CRP-like cAMP-binding protein